MMARMTALLRRGILAAGLLALASATALSQAPASGAGHDQSGRDPDGVQVMSDTAQWCAHLAGEVAQLQQSVAPPHEQADMLAREGKRLCAAGHIRLGIIRLRYALIDLEGQ